MTQAKEMLISFARDGRRLIFDFQNGRTLDWHGLSA